MTKSSVLKLLEEPQIVVVKQPDILYPVPENRDPLDADAPGEAGMALGIVADRLEHCRMHHAAAAELDPPGPLAHRAAGAVALPATEVDFRARLRVREKTRTEPHAHGRREHLSREREQRSLQIGE